MKIYNLNAEHHSHRQRVMAQAQTIMNYFVDALEQNECNVKLVVGMYTEIKDTLDGIKDLENAIYQPIYSPDYWKEGGAGYVPPTSVSPEVPVEQAPPALVEEAKEALKERCFSCRVGLPTFEATFDVDFMYEKLKVQLEVYRVVFRTPLSVSLCQASFVFQRTCIPDLVRLIGLFLSAYSAILAMKKLPKVTLGVFVKAVIGKLMAQVVGSVKLTVDLTSTGIPCVIAALKDIAYNMPTPENLKTRLSPEQYATLGSAYQPISEVAKGLAKDVQAGKITQEEADELLDAYKKKNDTINYYADKLQGKYDNVQEEVDKGIKLVTDTADKAIADVNAYIESILAVINFLQCEGKRTGSDFTEVVEYINNIQNVVNLISSIIAFIAKQHFRYNLCKEAEAIAQLKRDVIEAPIPDLASPQAIQAIVEEYTGKKALIDSEGLHLLIYDKPAPQLLPKLTLVGCNLREFAQAHTLDNIIKQALASEESERVFDRENLSAGASGDKRLERSDSYSGPQWPSLDNETSPRVYGANGEETFPPLDRAQDTSREDTLAENREDQFSPSWANITKESDTSAGVSGDKRLEPDRAIPLFKIPLLKDNDRDPEGVSYGSYRQGWIKAIDDVLDFIYTAPAGKPQGKGSPLLDTGDPLGTFKDKLQEALQGEEEGSSSQQEYLFEGSKGYPSGALRECRSVEDVLRVLEGIRV